MDRFPHAKKFDQLSGAGLGLLKAVVLTAAVVYVLASLGMISREQLRSSLLLGKLCSLWRGAGG
jgi:high-affinity Fe2+/Pb2+ permease